MLQHKMKQKMDKMFVNVYSVGENVAKSCFIHFAFGILVIYDNYDLD